MNQEAGGRGRRQGHVTQTVSLRNGRGVAGLSCNESSQTNSLRYTRVSGAIWSALVRKGIDI